MPDKRSGYSEEPDVAFTCYFVHVSKISEACLAFSSGVIRNPPSCLNMQAVTIIQEKSRDRVLNVDDGIFSKMMYTDMNSYIQKLNSSIVIIDDNNSINARVRLCMLIKRTKCVMVCLHGGGTYHENNS